MKKKIAKQSKSFMILLQMLLQMTLLCESLATFVTFISLSLMKIFFMSGEAKSISKGFFAFVTLELFDSIMDCCSV